MIPEICICHKTLKIIIYERYKFTAKENTNPKFNCKELKK